MGASATAMAADVPCARCRHRAVGLGRRQGPAASPTGVLTRVVKPQAQVSGTSTTTANHCKGPRRYQCLSRLGRSHTHAPTLACPTALCRDGTRRVSSACAICKLLLREYAFARGGGGGDCRQIQPRAHSLTQARLHANRRAPWRISGQAAVTGHLRDALERPNRPLSSAYRPAHIGPIA